MGGPWSLGFPFIAITRTRSVLSSCHVLIRLSVLHARMHSSSSAPPLVGRHVCETVNLFDGLGTDMYSQVDALFAS